MANGPGAYIRWLNALVLLAFGWVAILLELAPLNEEARALPAPDLLFCVAAVMVLRRPSSTPAFLIVALGLARDLIGGGPVGLGALTLLGAVEALRALGDRLRRRGVTAMILTVFAAAAGMMLAQVVLLLITLAPLPAMEQLGLRLVETWAAYVLIYVLFRWGLRMGAETGPERRLSRRSE